MEIATVADFLHSDLKKSHERNWVAVEFATVADFQHSDMKNRTSTPVPAMDRARVADCQHSGLDKLLLNAPYPSKQP